MPVLVAIVLMGSLAVMTGWHLRRPKLPPGFHMGQFVIYRSSTMCRIIGMGAERDGSLWVRLAALVDSDGRIIKSGTTYAREPLSTIEPLDIASAHRIMVRAKSRVLPG